MTTLPSVARCLCAGLVALSLGASMAGCKRNTEQAAQPGSMNPGDPTSAASATPGAGPSTGSMGQNPGTPGSSGTTSSDGMAGGMSGGAASSPMVPNGASGPQGSGGTP